MLWIAAHWECPACLCKRASLEKRHAPLHVAIDECGQLRQLRGARGFKGRHTLQCRNSCMLRMQPPALAFLREGLQSDFRCLCVRWSVCSTARLCTWFRAVCSTLLSNIVAYTWAVLCAMFMHRHTLGCFEVVPTCRCMLTCLAQAQTAHVSGDANRGAGLAQQQLQPQRITLVAPVHKA